MRGSGFAKASFVAALTAALLAAFAPTYTSCEAQAGGTCGYTTGLSVNGPWVLVVASVPVVLALLAVLVPRRWMRIVTAVLLWVCCAIAVASIGFFFVPAAILMTIASVRHDRVAAPLVP
jgi:hypothetical protein